MDIAAMESSEGQVGQGKGKMGRLPETVEGAEVDGPKELVGPRVLHDQLSNCCFHRRAPDHLFHFSLHRAMLAGLRTLIQTGTDQIDRYRPPA
jgi:hypothetical protein